MNKPIKPFTVNRQSGLSLIELMIALFIQFLLIGGLVYSYVSSKVLYNVNEQLARLQENGRYATNVLQYDLRMSGYTGCLPLGDLIESNQVNVIADPMPASFNIGEGITAYENGSGWTNPTTITRKTDTDVLTLQSLSGIGTHLTGNMSTENANIQVAGNPDGLEADDLILVFDCKSADLFRATSVSNGSTTVTIAHANNANTTNRLSRKYQEDARIMPFDAHTYFIGIDTDGEPGLYQYSMNSDVAVLLVNGVDNFQLYYAEDNNGDGAPDIYNDAATVTDWSRVIGVRAGLLLRSNDGATSEARQFTFDGNQANPGNDKRLRKAFWSYVALRNKIN